MSINSAKLFPRFVPYDGSVGIQYACLQVLDFNHEQLEQIIDTSEDASRVVTYGAVEARFRQVRPLIDLLRS